MGYGYGMGGFWGFGMMAFWILVVVGVVLLIRWYVSATTGWRSPANALRRERSTWMSMGRSGAGWNSEADSRKASISQILPR